ncbi:MAG: TlpA family protein disulfide reductase [Pirellulaceae bacterium]
MLCRVMLSRKYSLLTLVVVFSLSGCTDRRPLSTSSPTFSLDFALTDVEGEPLRLADYRGKVVIVDFWGTWCPPCREEIPSFVRLQETYGPQGLQIIGLTYERSEPESAAQTVREFMAANGINYPCALGTQEIRDQVPNFEGFPTTIFLDKTGQVRAKEVGLHDYEYLESIVTSLLAE